MTYTADSPILAPATPHNTALIATRIINRSMCGAYTPADVLAIVTAYFTQAAPLGVDPVIAIAQMLHETDWLRSFWSQRPQRNPAGIGVTGEHAAAKPSAPGWGYNMQRGRWEKGVSFASWADDAIPAHLGRLVMWAVRRTAWTPVQLAATTRAAYYRPLPLSLCGTAPTIAQLGAAHNATKQGWAVPGDGYGASIADVANALLS